MRVGAGPAQTRIVCAAYQQDPAVSQPLLSLLPDVLQIPAGQGSQGLEAALGLLATEARQHQPGASAVLDKVVDILLIQVLRWWLATSLAGQPPACWLSALTDPVAGPALAAIHGEPGRGWTVDTLARQTGVSRATLARRFRDRVGMAPGAYLTSWRMDLAARRLRDTDESTGAIARSLGYTSEYAFNRAFARARNMPPGRYRTASQTPRIPPAS
jgi:AraC-like DNA-binding protein